MYFWWRKEKEKIPRDIVDCWSICLSVLIFPWQRLSEHFTYWYVITGDITVSSRIRRAHEWHTWYVLPRHIYIVPFCPLHLDHYILYYWLKIMPKIFTMRVWWFHHVGLRQCCETRSWAPAADDKIVDTKLMMWRQKPSPSPALSNELETGSQMSRGYSLSRVTTASAV